FLKIFYLFLMKNYKPIIILISHIAVKYPYMNLFKTPEVKT
ncbi:hypothetical protein NT04LM_4343, partial [Listeria monocytogenes FSL F2-208]